MPTKKQPKQKQKQTQPATIIHDKPTPTLLTPTPSRSQIECNGSEDWMRNKIRRGAMVYYQCEAIIRSSDSTTKQCRNRAVQTIIVPGSDEDVYNNADMRLCGIHRQYSPSKTVA